MWRSTKSTLRCDLIVREKSGVLSGSLPSKRFEESCVALPRWGGRKYELSKNAAGPEPDQFLTVRKCYQCSYG